MDNNSKQGLEISFNMKMTPEFIETLLSNIVEINQRFEHSNDVSKDDLINAARHGKDDDKKVDPAAMMNNMVSGISQMFSKFGQNTKDDEDKQEPYDE